MSKPRVESCLFCPTDAETRERETRRSDIRHGGGRTRAGEATVTLLGSDDAREGEESRGSEDGADHVVCLLKE